MVKDHHEGRKLRKMTRLAQFVTLWLAQLSDRSSLRDIVSNISVQSNKLCHFGVFKISRTLLARINEQQSHALYEALFNKLLARCQGFAPTHGFRFKNKLYSLDASTIDLCLSVFPWAKFRITKGAARLNVGLDRSRYLLTFMTVTDGKAHDVTVGRTLKLPKQSIVIFDRGYTDYK